MSANENFENIYETYHPKIHRYLTRLTNSQEAEDLAQDVFVKVSQALDDFKGKSNISTWIYRIATNAAIDKLRSASFKQSKDHISEDDLANEDKSALSDKKVLSIDQQVIEREMNECIRNYIDDLPDNYRTVLVLSELEVLKNKEIADILEISLETVKIRLHRARTRLKKVLEGNCQFYFNDQNQFACEPK